MNKTRQSVILGTNVLLAGVLERVGSSAFLHRLRDHFQFLVPEGVVTEALDVVGLHRPTHEREIFRTLLTFSVRELTRKSSDSVQP